MGLELVDLTENNSQKAEDLEIRIDYKHYFDVLCDYDLDGW